MKYDRDLLTALSKFPSTGLERIVYRHMFANYLPHRENTLGARWNPPQVPAIYTSLSREGVLAEAEYQIDNEPLRPKVKRTVYQISVRLSSVLNLTDFATLASVGIAPRHLTDIDHTKCRTVGGAVEYLEHDGLLVPSSRLPNAINLVVFPNRQSPTYEFRTEGSEIIFDPEA